MPRAVQKPRRWGCDENSRGQNRCLERAANAEYHAKGLSDILDVCSSNEENRASSDLAVTSWLRVEEGDKSLDYEVQVGLG